MNLDVLNAAPPVMLGIAVLLFALSAFIVGIAKAISIAGPELRAWVKDRRDHPRGARAVGHAAQVSEVGPAQRGAERAA